MSATLHEFGAGLRAKWPALRRYVIGGFVLLVAVLLVQQARDVQWEEVMRAARSYRFEQLGIAAALTVLGYLLYSCYDVMGKFYTGHELSVPRSMAVAFVSYAFNLNLGSLVGGVGFRYRLYSKLGLSAGTVTRVLGMSLVTNWLGYFWVAGAVFASGAVRVPEGWPVNTLMLRLIGAVLLLAAAGYVLACGVSRRRSWQVHGHEIELPRLRVAVMQSLVAAASWSVIGLVLYVLVPGDVPYPTVLGVLLLSGIAGAVTHIPAGLGVIEAVFVMLLGSQVPRNELLGALLMYRAVYYLLPLALAAAAYVAMEAGTRRASRAAADPS